MKLKRWLCLIALALVCVILPLAITAQLSIDKPACTCFGAFSVAGHQQECAYRVFFKDLYKEKTAEELAQLWTQLSGDEQNFILNDVSWNVDQTKRQQLIDCLNGKETVPETTAAEESQPEGTAPGETVPNETTPVETVPGETIPEETVPEETVPRVISPEESKQEEQQTAVLSDETTGVQVEGKDLPQGITLRVTNMAKRQSPSRKSGPVFRYDITLLDENNDTWQPERTVQVKVPVNAEAGEKLAIVHTHGSDTYLLDVVTVQADGTVEFTTDGFSEFAGFTVDFLYNEVSYSIDGMTSVYLSELFDAMDIEEDASKATQVVFSDPSLIEVTQQDSDWLLTSLEAFDTTEALLVTFSDGHSIAIEVTDEEYMGQPGTYHIYRLFGDRSDYYIEYNSTSKAGGSSRIYFYYYNNAQNSRLDDDYGAHYWSWTSGDGMAQATTWYPTNNALWFYIYKTEKVYMNNENRRAFQMGKSALFGTAELYFTSYSTALSWSQASGATINPNNLCSISIDSRVATGTETRKVQVYYNNKLAGETSALFPVKNDTADGYDERNGLLVSQKNSSRYQLQTHTVNFSGSGNQTLAYTYDYNTKTYRIDFYDYSYQLNYNVNGGNGSVAATTAGPTASASYAVTVTSTVPTRNGYRFLGWADSASATAAQYTAGGTVTITGTKGTSGSTVTASKTVYAVWSAIPSVTIHHYLEGTTTKLADDTVVALPYNQSVTTSSYAKTITHYGYASSSPASFTVGTTAAGNTATIYYKVTTTYQITYSTGGGSAVTSQTKYYNSSITLSTTKPTKTGYTFQYWTGSDGNTYQPGGTYSTNAALTLTAKWSPVNYDITCNLAGGRLTTSNPGSYNIESAAITLNQPVRDGYIFTGWTGSNGTTPQKEVTIPTGSTGDKNYTATWSAESYGITYDLAGGTLAATNPGSYTVESATFTLNQPTKTGYTFAGWTGSNGTTPQKEVTVSVGSYGEKAYTANWTPNTYTVRFDGNGATSGTTADQSFTYNVSQPLNKNGYQRQYTVTYMPQGGTVTPTAVTADATFNGWYLNGTLCRDGVTVSNLTTENNVVVTMTADWTLATVTLAQPQLANYAFLGWYDAAEGGNKVGDAGDVITPTGNMTLYAQWSRAGVLITASVSDGRGTATPEKQLIAVGADASVTFTANSGYLLDYITVNGTRVELDSVTSYTHSMTGLTEDQTLIAYAIPNAYTVTYDAAGGEASQQDQIKYYGVDLTLLATIPERTGYKFLYWLGSDGQQYEAGATYKANRELTLTAQWQVQYRFQLQFNANTTDSITSMPADLAMTPWQDGSAYSYSWQEAPQRLGYTFQGWSLDSNATEATVNNAYVLTGTEAETKSATLYAVWQENTATFTYKLDGSGSLSITTETVPVKTGSSSGATVTLPTGYKLVGWYDANGNLLSTELDFVPERSDDGIYESAAFTARVVQKVDDLVITITNPKTPIIVTVHYPNGEDLTFVANATVTVPNMPEGEYTVTAEAWGADYNASVTTINGTLREGTPAAFSVGLSEKAGWSVVTAWIRNFFGMNDRSR